MKKKVLETLEFTKVIQQLEAHAASSLGAEKCSRLVPLTDLEAVLEAQKETDEAATAYRLKGFVPLDGIHDIRAHVKRAMISGMLSPNELMEISATLRTTRGLVRFLGEFGENETDLPILSGYRNSLDAPKELSICLTEAISETGEVLDSASDNLRFLRHKLQSDGVRVREKLESLLRSSSVQKMLSDTIITIRGDRYVLPVKLEYRQHFGGVVHDQSASGQTVFIEPQSVQQLNNALSDIRLKIQIEIDKILFKLSAAVAEYADSLLQNVEILGHIDFAFAKAKYGKVIGGSRPLMNDHGFIQLNKARHPFIPINEVVANDVVIGADYSTIVITGPNTGGKTVALKTVGLCTLMAMSGLQIPAHDGSEVAVFKQVFADVGDEQSIEQSLSTFSSHMVNIVEILEDLDHESLVLFDELGAGTDPGEGAALAIAILDESMNRGARVIATTHYPELKAYGYNRENVMNASVEFDVETLSPTYRLLIGIPGKSNAFEISRKLGLNERLIINARKMVGTDTNAVENMIVALEQARNIAEEHQKDAEARLEEVTSLRAELENALLTYQEQKETQLEKAQKEAIGIIEKAKHDADEIIRELRSMRLNAQSSSTEKDWTKVKKRLDEAKPETVVKESVKMRKKHLPSFEAGDDVIVLSLDQQGVLLERSGADAWTVQLGIMKMKVAITDMTLVNKAKKPEMRQVTILRGKSTPVTSKLDLRGERYEAALMRLEKFLDDALLANYPSVSIIHGHGTGALRQGVHQYLKRHRAVKSYRFGGQGEGGMGATIVELK